MEVSGPACLVANAVEQPAKQRLMVHLVNYNPEKTPALKPAEVTCRVPAGQSAKGIRIYSPDAAEPKTLAMKSDSSKVSCTVSAKTDRVHDVGNLTELCGEAHLKRGRHTSRLSPGKVFW